MEAVIKKWGNSPALRLPAALVKTAALKLDQKVRITALDGKIMIEPLEAAQYQLEALLQDITPANLHGEISFGRPQGQESL